MFESLNIQRLIDWAKTLPVRWRIVVLLCASAVAAVLLFSSCSRSALRFKGSGDIEYYYEGRDYHYQNYEN